MSGWHRALAWALTGEALELPDHPVPDADALVAELDACGWNTGRIRAHAVETAGVRPWPHPVPDALRSGLGAAQLHAALGAARARLGLDVLAVAPPSRRTRLDADERRLLAEAPPHFGRG